MTDSVASLGFQVDSSGLDQAKQKLGEVTTSAKSTEDQAKKTGDAVSNIGKGVGSGPKQLAAGLSEAEQAARTAGTSVTVLESIVRRTGGTMTEAAQRIAGARIATTATAAASTELGTALSVVAPAANRAAVAVAAKAVSLRDLNLAFRTASPLLNEFDSGLGRIFTSSTRARGSVGVLAAVVGGELALGLAKSADQVLRSQKLFEGLTGSTTAGRNALEKVREITKASNADFDTMASTLAKVTQGQADFGNKSIIYANGSEQAEKQTVKYAETLGQLQKILETSGATAKEEKEIFAAVGDSVQRTGGLTADAFQKIRDANLKTAREISTAFRFNDINEFQRQLEKTPITLDQLADKLRQIAPLTDAAFSSRDVTVEQRLREVIKAWEDLEKTIGQAGGFKLAKDILDALAESIRLDAEMLGRFSAALSSLGSIAGGILSGIQREAGAAAAAIANAAAGRPQQLNGPSPVEPFGGELSNDIQLGGAFASGGSFVVSGSGGTDSQAVTFKATPGEIVTIATPDQAASGIATLTAVPGNTDIEDLLKEQTKQIVEAINGLKIPPTNTVPVSSIAGIGYGGGGGGVPAFGVGGSGGGGGGGSTSPFKALEDRLKQEEAALQARERELSGGGGGGGGGGGYGFSGVYGGQGNSISGGFGSSSFPDYSPVSSFGDLYNSSGSFDYTPLDFSQMGSSSFDESGFAGSFASGGSFTVGGDGGTDTTPIRLNATKGERVTITPAGMMAPSSVKVSPSMLRPGAGDGAAPSRTVNNVTNKKVTINVQAGISADTIMRSRAQIARAM